MKRLAFFNLIILLIVTLLNKPSLQAQSVSIDSLLKKALATDELLPLLIDSAIRYSPEIRRIAGSEEYASANLQMGKKAILSAVGLHSSYNYGTNYSAVISQSSPVAGSNLTTAQTGFYNVGVGIQLPITYVLNRRNIIKAGRSQVNMATAEKDNAALLIKQEVIRLYQEFKLSQKLMTASTRNKESAQINNAMSEKEFKNGQSTLDKVSAVLESYNRSVIEYETYVNRFQTSYMQLEAFTGTSLSSLIRQVK